MKEEYKERFCDLDNASKAMCLAMFAIENKLGHCNKKYIAEQFKKLSNDNKRGYVFSAQRLARNFWKCLPSKED